MTTVGMCVAACQSHGVSPQRVRDDLHSIGVVAQLYVAEHMECPSSVAILVSAKLLAPGSGKDPWGNEIRIDECEPESMRVSLTSAGEDRRFGTQDDVVLSVGSQD